MSLDTNKARVRQFFETVDKMGHREAIEYLATDAAIHIAGLPAPLDRESYVELSAMFTQGFSDGRHIIEGQVAEGDLVTSRGRWLATHTGTFQGIPASGRSVDFEWARETRFRDGKMVEIYVLFDQLGLMQQIGALPQPAGAAA